MEVWTLINKKSREIIRCDKIVTDDPCFGTEYFFTTETYAPLWFVSTEEQALKAYQKFTHPQFRMFYTQPSTDDILVEDYEIKKFYIKND